jgi:hypothetical protein
MPRKGPIHVHLEGRGPVALRETDYVTSGGEGAIYKTGTTIVKIYTDPDKMARDGMPEKIKTLAQLQRVGIVAPEGLAIDENRKPIGFYMPFVRRADVAGLRFGLPDRTGFADQDAVDLAADMHSIVIMRTAKQALLVDANELNWLVHRSRRARLQRRP